MVAGKIRLRANSAHYVKCTSARFSIVLGMISFQERDCVTCHISIATFFQNCLSPKRINCTKVLPLLEIQWPICHADTSSCS